ncbi:nucleotide exchange factor GrpE, partial [Nakamurella silvestris]
MHQNAAAPSGGPAPSDPPVTTAPWLTDPPDQEPDLVSGLVSAHDLAQGPAAAAVQVQLERTLRLAGVERIHLTAGDPFDPDTQRAVSTESTPDAQLVGRVAREVRPGWLWGG